MKWEFYYDSPDWKYQEQGYPEEKKVSQAKPPPKQAEPRSTIMYCYKEDGIYWNFYPSVVAVRMCKPEADVLKVKVKETEESDECYWGWWSNEQERFLFVYDIKGKVEMCFPYGTKVREEQGIGRLLPVSIEEISEGGG